MLLSHPNGWFVETTVYFFNEHLVLFKKDAWFLNGWSSKTREFLLLEIQEEHLSKISYSTYSLLQINKTANFGKKRRR